MSDNERMDDAQFVHQILTSLPTTAVPAALEARLLADFDRLAARSGLWRRIGDRLWPGVPAWKPASSGCGLRRSCRSQRSTNFSGHPS